MAQKTISELQLISSITNSLNIPGDDGIQSYRATAAQFFTYIRSKFASAQTISAAGTTLTSSDVLVFLNPTSAAFTQDIPAVAAIGTGAVLYLKNIATNSNIVTLDGASSELVGDYTTMPLRPGEGVYLYNNGTKWEVLSATKEDPRTNVVTATTTKSVLVSEDMILCSGSAFTATLYTAVGNAGRTVTFRKTDSSSSNIITIATTSSQTIGDGSSTSTTLRSKNDLITLVSDGANWKILNKNVLVAASYYCSTGQSSSTTQPINYDTAEYDTHSAVTVGASWKFTVPPDEAGVYQINCVNNANNVAYSSMLYKGGTAYKMIAYNNGSIGGAAGSVDVLLADGDYVDVRSTVNYTMAGGALNAATTSNVNIKKIR